MVCRDNRSGFRIDLAGASDIGCFRWLATATHAQAGQRYSPIAGCSSSGDDA